ncbi:hypothetical protein [Variovorax sp. dw_954]|nr:hypothetical protein [Variovorax sp. dw_954]
MAGYKRPRTIAVIGDAGIPLTATRKVLHRTLRERMASAATQ